MKKVFATLLALVLVLAACTSAMAATITIDPNLPNGTTTNGNETYKAYQIFEASINGVNVAYTINKNSPFFSVIQADTTNFTLTEVVGTDLYTVAKTDAFDNDAAKELASKLEKVENKEVAGTASWNATNSKYVISDLANGYYLVTSSVGSALILDTFGDVEVDTKNAYPSLDKTVDKTDGTADMGDTVTFTIKVTIPQTAVGEIVVHDKMTGLTFEALTNDSILVIVENGNEEENSCTKHFILSSETVQANLGKSVDIKYTATVTADAAKNEAWLEDNGFASNTDTVEVKNYKIDVFKYTKDNNDTETGLAGAGFMLKNTEDKYYAVNSGVVTWVDDIAQATELMTSEENSNTVTFAGLANGTYTLVEKTVPAGYNPASDTTVEIKDADLTGATQIKVLNSTGSELPSTGGIGTTIFYVVGGLLMIGALVLLITKKKVSAK